MANLADRLKESGRFGPHCIGNFDILGVLGRGSMGLVYKAFQPNLNRVIALKVLDPELATDPTQVKRFLREARSAAKLSHPNIVALHDVGTCTESGLHYLALEFVDGPSLATELARVGRFSERRALEICREIASALTCAEEAKILHRDVKPENILLTASGCPKLSDLGLAKRQDSHSLTAPGSILGSAHYVSPEQALGIDHPDTRSDIYSLGVTLYRLVTGALPFAGDSFFEIVEKHIEHEVPDPRSVVSTLSEQLALVVRSMCARDREERYATASDLERDLQRVLAGLPAAGLEGPPVGETNGVLAKHVPNFGDSTEAKPYELLIQEGGSPPRTIHIDLDRASLGRSPECDVVIDNTRISRHHAELVRAGLTLSLAPLSRTNDTAVNDEPVTETVLLGPDDTIILSETVLIHFRWTEPGSAPEGENLDDTTRVLRQPETKRETEPAFSRSPAKGPDDGEDEEGSYTTKVDLDLAKGKELPSGPYRFPRGFVVHQRGSATVRDRVHRGFQLGRSSLCDARLPASAPRKAALVVRCENSYRLWNVCDDASRVTLNGEPVPDQAALEDGDVIVVYGVEVRFEQPR